MAAQAVIDAQLDAAFVVLGLVVAGIVVELVVEHLVDRHVGQFIRGQSWPSGSIGNPHH